MDPEAPTLDVLSRPAARTADTTVSIGFVCGGKSPPCTVECSVDAQPSAPCTSPFSAGPLTEGAHVVTLRATNARAKSTEVRVEFVVDLSPPRAVSAAFSALDALDVTFDEPLDPASLAPLDSFALSPVRPTGLSVVGAHALSDSTVRLELSGYHLPLKYQLTASVRDTLGHASGPLQVEAVGTSSRIIFVSTSATTGKIDAWTPPDGSQCPGSGGLARADCLCQWDASNAGLVGTFRATLADTQNELYCRLRGLSGKKGAVSGPCNTSEPLPLAGPWLRMDGQPLALGPLSPTGEVLNPIAAVRFQADGSSYQGPVWHSRGGSGGSDRTCLDWTSNAISSTTRGTAEYPWTTVLDQLSGFHTCDMSYRLLCASVGPGGFPLGTRHLRPGKHVFLTSTRTKGALAHPSGATGLAAADAQCRDLATAAGLAHADRFVAWLSDGTNDASCRAAGFSGKRASNCGQATLPNVQGPYVSTVGQLLAQDLAALASSPLQEPFLADERGMPGYGLIWTGTANDGAADPSNCQNWSNALSGSQVSYQGRAAFVVTQDWTNYPASSCGNDMALACVER